MDHLIALDPHQMSQAQNWLIGWCDNKMNELQTEREEAQGIGRALRAANMSDMRAKRLLATIEKRALFYAKVRAALAEGYYILPPIPHQTFAIRSNQELPPPNRQIGHTWKADEPKPIALPAGVGEYHNATVKREHVDQFQQAGSDGKPVTKHVYQNTDWNDVEFPFFPVKPEIIEATGKALSKKIFDWLGVAPNYRTADPIVIGCLKHWKPNEPPLHFFVAWWLDVRTL